MKMVKTITYRGGRKHFQIKGTKSKAGHYIDKESEVESILFSKSVDGFTGRSITFNAFICDVCKQVCRTMDESPIDNVCEICEAKSE